MSAVRVFFPVSYYKFIKLTRLYIISTKEKSQICTDDLQCDFCTCDPASLLRHRKRKHGYIPGVGHNATPHTTTNNLITWPVASDYPIQPPSSSHDSHFHPVSPNSTTSIGDFHSSPLAYHYLYQPQSLLASATLASPMDYSYQSYFMPLPLGMFIPSLDASDDVDLGFEFKLAWDSDSSD